MVAGKGTTREISFVNVFQKISNVGNVGNTHIQVRKACLVAC